LEVVNMTLLRARTPTTLPPTDPSSRRVPSAVVWIDARRAVVATMNEKGRISSRALDRGDDPEAPFLARVVHAIGDRERVIMLGPDMVRLALEREYVAIFHTPDRLVDVEPSGPVYKDQLEDRVRELAG
jgi:hypothetical protein